MTGRSIRSRAPSASSPAVRRVMIANPSRDTRPEVCLRAALHSVGTRFRKDARPEPALRCTADVVFRRQRLCVFIDGCFWHRCSVHFSMPKSHAGWWAEKIQATVDRDGRQRRLLRKRGWRVLRVWEHQLHPGGIAAIVSRIRALLQGIG